MTASIAAPCPTPMLPDPDGCGFRQRFKKTAHEREFKQNGVVHAGLRAGSDETENTFAVVQANHRRKPEASMHQI